MDFDFLFQNFEGVLSLTKRKAKVLTFLSLAGLLISVVLTAFFAFDIDKAKYIPGIIVLGIMMVLNIIFLLQGSYKSAVRVALILPLALYFLYVNNYYAIATNDRALTGILSMIYFGFIYLVIFSYSFYLLIFFFIESLIILIYFLFINDYFFTLSWFDNTSIFSQIHPIVEMSVVAFLAILVYIFYEKIIDRTAAETYKSNAQIGEVLRQVDAGVMVFKIKRDELGEKSGLQIIRTNNQFNRLFKVTPEEISDTDFSIIFPKIFRDSFNWQDVFFHSLQSRVQVKIEHLDQWFIINNVYPETDLTISTFTEISNLKMESERLKIRERRLTNLMGSLPDIFFIIERDGTYIDYVSNNPELMKISQDDIIGKTIFEMGFSKPMSYQIYSSIQYVLEKDNIETIEYGMELPSGKSLIFEMRLARLSDNQVISIGRDITFKKEYEQQLIEAKKITEEASRLKASFLENISHEMRTPMNAIIGFSTMASSERYTDDEKKNFLDIVISNGESLMKIITDVIDISEIDTGNISVKMNACKVNELFISMYEKFQKVLDKTNKPVEIELKLKKEDRDLEIYTDSNLLLKVVNHLVDNAIKFTNEGKVTYGYEKVDKNIKIFIEDTGIGIDGKHAKDIYNQFHQADNRRARKYSGTGAGLNIAKSIIELLGGNLDFESTIDEGSRFYFFLPINSFLKVV